ncbi:MAG: tyrosine-protein kinase family protein [Terriglobia bacterium]
MSRIRDAIRRAEEETGKTAATPQPEAGNGESSPPPMEAAVSGLMRTAGPKFDEMAKDSELFRAITEHCPASEWAPDPGTILFYDADFRTPGSEEFRTLRSRLELVRERQPLQTILITSPMPGEGKTFVAANLAQVFVWQREQHVLLIDGDLRASRLHSVLGVPGIPGLSDYLSGKIDEFGIIKRGPLDNFFFIPGGTPAPNASELIANGRFRRLLNRFGVAFDWIIIDSPPAIPIADARLMAALSDGVLVVVRLGQTPGDLAQQVYQEFRGKAFVGIVLNEVDPRSTYGYAYYEHKDKPLHERKGSQ